MPESALKPLPSQDELNRLLRYEGKTGKVFWRERTVQPGQSPGRVAYWNSCYAGKEALCSLHGEGYLCGQVKKQQYLAHRVIWKMVHGEEPEQIDHIDGDRSNNRLQNLRAATYAVNAQNSARRKTNRSGVTGVSWDKVNEKWIAQIAVNGLAINLGRFGTFEQALAARKAAERKYNFHPNHGR